MKNLKILQNSFSIFYLDRPEAANALDKSTAALILDQAMTAVKKGELGFIISSRHPRVFCAGGDLRAYSKMNSKKQGVTANGYIRKTLGEFRALPLFVISAVEGEAIGGGCELALACDWIIASSGASFSFKQVRQGLTTGWGGSQRLLERVTPSAALEWLTSGRTIGATEAFRAGLIDEICSPGKAVDEARRYLTQRAPITPQLLKSYKALISKRGLGEKRLFDGHWLSPTHRKALKGI